MALVPRVILLDQVKHLFRPFDILLDLSHIVLELLHSLTVVVHRAVLLLDWLASNRGQLLRMMITVILAGSISS